METQSLGGATGALQLPSLATQLITKSLNGVAGASANPAGPGAVGINADAGNGLRVSAMADKGVGTMVNVSA